jgi:REP element-mobilizing transposase RayT
MTPSHGMTHKRGDMRFEKGKYYHLYNRSNNNEPLFYTRENYTYFLEKIKNYLTPQCSVLAYCLMPTHFHLLVRVQSDNSLFISKQVAVLLRSYTRAINKRYSRHGNLFQQNTKARVINDERYLLTLMNYIHQNPLRSGIAKNLGDWDYSSFRELASTGSRVLADRDFVHKHFKTPAEFAKYSKEIVESVMNEDWAQAQ